MRLLNVDTLKLETFYEPRVPRYAALSHTWGKDEISFQDLEAGRGDRKSWDKINRSSTEAQVLGYEYIWIDTCCIDKTSSAELSEAINSMYRWYSNCDVCIAYLEDVCAESLEREDLNETVSCNTYTAPELFSYPTFSQARWFKRGWTLQELIAPPVLHFYDSKWDEIGEKQDLVDDIQRITGIDSDILRNQESLRSKSIARKMSWASERETTRVEDEGYCLMGIFDVNMPLLYGEGSRAFIRLQEEIMKRTYDHSLFAWNYKFPCESLGGTKVTNALRIFDGQRVLAPHPSVFDKSADFKPKSSKAAPYTTTNRGLLIHLCVVKDPSPSGMRTHIGLLDCCYDTSYDTVIGLPLARHAVRLGSYVAYPGPADTFCRPANENLIFSPFPFVDDYTTRPVYIHEIGPPRRRRN